METTVNLLPSVLRDPAALKTDIREQILSGNLNPLEFYRQAKIVMDTFEELKKDPEILECAFSERDKYGKEKAIINGSVIESGQRTTQDYSACGDPEWERLKRELKERENFLKSVKAPINLVRSETGEVVTIYPPTLKISSFITVKL